MLHIKYRPQNLEQVFGHKHIVDSLNAMIDGGNIVHTLMFYGASGCGKTTIARIFGSALDCEIIEKNAADDRGIDAMRNLIYEAKTGSFFTESKNRLFILDEAHSITKDAQNCLLKIIEDTPKHTYFIFCTTDPKKIIGTIKNRCTQFEFNKLSRSELSGLLKYVSSEEGIAVDDDKRALLLESSEGCPRQLLVNLNMVRDIEDLEESAKLIYKKSLETDSIDIMRAVLKGAKWKMIADLFTNLPPDTDYENLRLGFLGYLSSCLKGSDSRNKLLYFSHLMEIFCAPTSYISQKEDMLMRIAQALLVTSKK